MGKKSAITAKVLGSVVGNSNTAPLYSSRPAAGFPAPGDDMVERALDINDLVVKHPTATFFVRVEGDSMEGAGIFSNDVLVVDRAVEPRHNMIVVAAVYGEMVVKRLVLDTEKTKVARGKTSGKGGMMLVSENEAYEPISVNENDDCHIWGVVVGSVRQF